MNRKWFLGFAGFACFLFFLIIATTSPADAQCAMCRASVESSAGSQDTIANGLNKGILYLMTVPYLIIGCIGFFWYRYSKKKQ